MSDPKATICDTAVFVESLAKEGHGVEVTATNGGGGIAAQGVTFIVTPNKAAEMRIGQRLRLTVSDWSQ